MKLVGPLEKTDAKAIQLEVVLNDSRENKLMRPKAATLPRGSPKKKRKENLLIYFTESVQLCCLTMTAGPGTSFGDFNIPQGVSCSVCGSALGKGRM